MNREDQVNENQAQESQDDLSFDVNAFNSPEGETTEAPTVDNQEPEKPEVESTKEEPTTEPVKEDSPVTGLDIKETEIDDSAPSWGDYSAEEGDTEPSNDNSVENENPYLNVFKDKYGWEVKKEEELIEKVDSIYKQNEELKKYFPEKNEKIEKYEKILNLDDESIVRQNLQAQGFEGEELDQIYDRYLDSNVLDVEAKKVRKLVSSAMEQERQQIVESKLSEQARQKKETEDSVKRLNEFLNSSNTMFGLNVAKTPEEAKKVKEEHFKYITSGTFLSEITNTEKDLAEAAWLWKNREVILKAMKTRGSNQAKKQLIDKIGRPETDSYQRFTDPESGGEFNPNKFMQNN